MSSHRVPLAARDQALTAEAVQRQTVPQARRRPARPPLARVAQRQLRDVDLQHLAIERRHLPIVGKQRHLTRPRLALHNLDQAAPHRALAVVDLAEIQNLALNYPAAAHTDVLYRASVAVLLAASRP